jgi:hypothetical protein
VIHFCYTSGIKEKQHYGYDKKKGEYKFVFGNGEGTYANCETGLCSGGYKGGGTFAGGF